MSDSQLLAILEPLVQHKVFASPEEAVRQLVSDYVLRQIDQYRERVTGFEKRYGMTFEQFGAYIKERSHLLIRESLEAAPKKRLAQAIMTEEEDWLDWKIAKETLEDWLGLHTKA